MQFALALLQGRGLEAQLLLHERLDGRHLLRQQLLVALEHRRALLHLLQRLCLQGRDVVFHLTLRRLHMRDGTTARLLHRCLCQPHLALKLVVHLLCRLRTFPVSLTPSPSCLTSLSCFVHSPERLNLRISAVGGATARPFAAPQAQFSARWAGLSLPPVIRMAQAQPVAPSRA